MRPAPITAMLSIVAPSPSLSAAWDNSNQQRRLAGGRNGHDPTDHGAGAGALPGGAAHRMRRPHGAAVRRRVGDLRPRQCRRHRRGAGGASRRPADLSRAQRAGDGAGGDRLRQGDAPAAHDGLHHVDRPGRHQHDHRGGGGACRPAAGAAAARRRVRLAPARPGAAAGGELRRRHGIGERLLPPGVALLRSHHAARADPHGTAARAVGADRSGGVRPGDAGTVPGRAGRGVRLSRTVLRHAALACPPGPAGRRRTGGGGGSAAPRQGAAAHRRRRRALLRGDRGARSLRHRARHPGGGDPGGQERAAARSSLQSRRDRRHRHIGGEPGRGGGRCHPRGRHAAAGFHHRIMGAVPESRAPADRTQRAGVRRRQASHAAADRRCTRWADRAGYRARRPPRAGCLAATPDRRRRRRGASRPPPSPRRPTPNCRRTRR